MEKSTFWGFLGPPPKMIKKWPKSHSWGPSGVNPETGFGPFLTPQNYRVFGGQKTTPKQSIKSIWQKMVTFFCRFWKSWTVPGVIMLLGKSFQKSETQKTRMTSSQVKKYRGWGVSEFGNPIFCVFLTIFDLWKFFNRFDWFHKLFDRYKTFFDM